MHIDVKVALIAGAVALVVACLQHWFFARRMKVLEADLAVRTKTQERQIENEQRKQTQRCQILERFWNASHIAHNAAESMIKTADTRDFDLLVERTARFIQGLVPLLTEHKSTVHDPGLSEEDRLAATEVRNEALRLFLTLDPDSGPKPEYQAKLAARKQELDRCIQGFRLKIEEARFPVGDTQQVVPADT